jgi:LmbE family N-acetylglucosaminyl deacetylase
MVFSPHFDDETLGCGGMILRKRLAGANVRIVFMTDGSRSHSHLMPADQLSAQRRNESLAAAEAMGVPPKSLDFLGFQETRLLKNADASYAVENLLLKHRPRQVFIPYRHDVNRDHETVNAIVCDCLARLRLEVEVFEYPIWFWNQWPWIHTGMPRARDLLWAACQACRSALRAFNHFTLGLDIGHVLHLKMRALQCYQSQMTRMLPTSDWKTLSDVANGRFLHTLLQRHEIFFRYPSKALPTPDSKKAHAVLH